MSTYTVVNTYNGEVMACDELAPLLKEVERREDFKDVTLEWTVKLEGRNANIIGHYNKGTAGKLRALEYEEYPYL